jgi:predicted dehydrogenase
MKGRGVNRREFIRRSAIGAAAAGVLGSTMSRPANARILGANDRINLGIIGVGGRGGAILGELLTLKKSGNYNIDVVAVCDVYERRLQAAARRCNGKAYGDYKELLAHPDLDAVAIATPDHWHARMSMDAMNAGKDIYCEKPMTLYWEEAKEVARVARETKRITQIGAQAASDPRFSAANKIISAGGIGRLIWSQTGSYRNDRAGDWNWPIDKNAGPDRTGPDHIDWKSWLGSAPDYPWSPGRFFRFRKYWDYSGGQATDLLYHSLAHHEIALGPEFPRRVAASGGNYIFNLENDDREVPDTFLVLIDYPTNHSVALVSTQVNQTRVPETIRAQKATITFSFERDGAERKSTMIITPEEPFKSEVEERTVSFDREPRDAYPHMRNFLDCVRSRKECNLNAQTGYKVMVPIGLSVKAYRENKVMLFGPETETLISSESSGFIPRTVRR